MARRRYRRRLRKRARGSTSKKPGLKQLSISDAFNLAFAIADNPQAKQLVKYIGTKVGIKSTPKGKTPVTRISNKVVRRGITYGGTVNVKADSERWTKTYYKQKVTKQQQRKINKRFKNDAASKIVYENDYPITETIPQQMNTCKWIWFSHNSLSFVKSAWDSFVMPQGMGLLGSTQVAGNPLQPIANKEQAIYFNKISSKYEIFNPTNYDMNVVIYDVVCKEDHTRPQLTNMNKPLVSISENITSDVTGNYSNPIALMYQGLQGVQEPNSGYQVGRDSTGESIFDVTFKPTSSYPFNMTWTVVGKKTVRLQPGASFNHKFTYKCKNLMNRGYYGYQYAEKLNTNYNGTLVTNATNTPVKGFTCGSLFKVWGQISGSTTNAIQAVGLEEIPIQSHPGGVVNLSGRIMIKEWYKVEYYNCEPKYSFKVKQTTSTWRPTDEEELCVPTTVNTEFVDDMDQTTHDDPNTNQDYVHD